MVPPQTKKRPTVFFDRDGVLNEDTGYPHQPSQIVWIDGSIEAVKYLNDAGYLVLVITNQAGVAQGYFDEPTVNSLHAWFNQHLANWGAHIDAFYYCPHHPNAAVERYRLVCSCRKPAPGLLLQAIAEWPVDLKRSILIGDKESDLAAAAAVNIKGVHFKSGNLFSFVKQNVSQVS